MEFATRLSRLDYKRQGGVVTNSHFGGLRLDGRAKESARGVESLTADAGGLSRRRFLGYVIAAPTLMTGVSLINEEASGAQSIPSYGQIAEYYDLIDFLRDSQLPTSNLITIQVNDDGTVAFDLHRTEVGQGITTSFAMIIADEMGIPLESVKMTLADARPELLWNQITGGSHSTYSLYTPVRIAAAIAREQLLAAAALKLGGEAGRLELVDGIVRGPDGQTLGVGDLAQDAAAQFTEAVDFELKDPERQTLVGTPQNRIDARSIVTGEKQFALDLEVPDALPTMVARPPTVNGTVVSVDNQAAVEAVPGVTDVAVVPTGVAIRAQTFGQCIDAIQILEVTWGPGTVDGVSDDDVQAQLEAAEIPVLIPEFSDIRDQLEALGFDLGSLGLQQVVGGGLWGRASSLLGQLSSPLPTSVQETFTFSFRPNTPVEPNCAVADVSGGHAEVWAPLKNPLVTKQTIEEMLGVTATVHVTQGGGSFGRELFSDAAYEGAQISAAMGKPVKLMWHRVDEFRQGRMHPAARSTIGALYTKELGVLAYNQNHTSVMTDFSHGLGDIISANFSTVPREVQGALNDAVEEATGFDVPTAGDIGYSQTVFHLTQYVPYNFGVVGQLLNEVNTDFRTSSMRNIYSPDVTTARELIIDRICEDLGEDAFEFRLRTLKDQRSKDVMAEVGKVGNWGRAMEPGTAQGLGFHSEYKGRAACLMEIDTRPETVNRDIPNAYAGPRITKAVFAVDVGKPINPRGLEAQMMGGLLDGLANALSYGLHLRDGTFLEGSWDQAYYTRQWNVPFEVEVIVMPPTSETPGGAGEFGVAAAMAAAACAYGRATGTMPTHFPINHGDDLSFTPPPTTPSVPQSPTDGLER